MPELFSIAYVRNKMMIASCYFFISGYKFDLEHMYKYCHKAENFHDLNVGKSM